MSTKDSDRKPQPDWPAFQREVEDELLDRAKEVARRITERVKKLTEDTAPGPALKPDEPTGEAPPLG
jgi:hypothetical protein